jgi:hypothetical protein
MTRNFPRFTPSAWTRRLIVTIVVGSAAAAVAANVAFHERLSRETVAGPAPMVVPAAAGKAVMPGHARRVQWRDPWQPRVSLPDPSVPSAHKALADVADPSAEPAPTF